MPKNKKDESSSDSDSGPEDRDPAPKKAKKSKADDEKKLKADAGKKSKDEKKSTPVGTGTNEWVLEGMRLAKVNLFNGRKRVDIREHYERDGKILPGKKGISLSPFQWQMLLEHAEEITKALK